MMKTSLRPESFHNLPPQDSILYRYLTIDKLIDFLLEDRISLVKLNLFEDKLEGVNLEYLQMDYLSDKISKQMQEEDTSLKYIGVNINPTGRNLLRRKRENFQGTNYGSLSICKLSRITVFIKIFTKTANYPFH